MLLPADTTRQYARLVSDWIGEALGCRPIHCCRTADALGAGAFFESGARPVPEAEQLIKSGNKERMSASGQSQKSERATGRSVIHSSTEIVGLDYEVRKGSEAEVERRNATSGSAASASLASPPERRTAR
jgi:hypothetical protein